MPLRLTPSLLLVSVLHVLQAGFLWWVAFDIAPCEVCDTTSYMEASRRLWQTGLLYEDAYSGYRSYFVPLLIALISKLPFAALGGAEGSLLYGTNAAIVFVAVSALVSMLVLRRSTLRDYLVLALPTLFNPFLLAHVPFPMQESAITLLCVPLLLLLFASRKGPTEWRVFVMLLMASLAYVSRGSLAWMYVPALLYCAIVWWQAVRTGERVSRPKLALAALLAVVPLLAPQMYISKQKFDTLDPYPQRGALSMQIAFSIDFLKYATVEDDAGWGGLPYYSPFVFEPDSEKNLGFYARYPARGAFLFASHVFSGFHYDVPRTYWRLSEARIASPWLLLSSAVVFLGVTGLAKRVFSLEADAQTLFCAATFALCAAYVGFIATEARFGMMGFIALSLAAAQALATDWRTSWRWMLPALALYVFLAFMFNTMLMQNADIAL